jgi:L-ascorbate metabolism protein UlaG (beta-lactamase superfamily)
MVIVLFLLALIVIAVMIFLRLPQFGSLPSGSRKERINKSPHFVDGQFRNLSHTPTFTEGSNFFSVSWEFLTNGNASRVPPVSLPSIKTDLLTLDPYESIIVWFGHSSYFLQIDGKKILVDPVFSGSASPVSFTTKSFHGSDIYSASDIPPLDYLFITHDHWDHLDYHTIKELKPKIKKVITGLGTGAHLERWGIQPSAIIEADWNEEIIPEPGVKVVTASARHFSGRGFIRNRSLWMSFVLQMPSIKLYLGGDSGYDDHFTKIGREHGPFDLAILECGQYNDAWKYIHMMPEETVRAGIDLGAKTILPVHWSKFNLSLSAWDDSIKRVTTAALEKKINLIHPKIGEKVILNSFSLSENWWEKVY